MGMPGGAVSHAKGVEKSVQVATAELDPISGGQLLQNCSDAIQMKGEAQAFPVFKAVPNSGLRDLHDVIAWADQRDRKDSGFGSMGPPEVFWTMNISDQRPQMLCTLMLPSTSPPQIQLRVPAVNNSEPGQRYQWKVLPQGSRNSPTICQWYVAQALSGVREQFPDVYCYRYKDGILVAAPTQNELLRIEPQLLTALRCYGLQVALEKVQ
ncbi:hypothetical protein TURU_008791 [Turdus rufiventris]|nr:hypothetical protein TURU_008791 [Turdus rufiventris]